MKGRYNVRNLGPRGEARDHELIWVTSKERILCVVVGATFKLKATERVCAHFPDHAMHLGTLSFESHISPYAVALPTHRLRLNISLPSILANARLSEKRCRQVVTPLSRQLLPKKLKERCREHGTRKR